MADRRGSRIAYGTMTHIGLVLIALGIMASAGVCAFAFFTSNLRGFEFSAWLPILMIFGFPPTVIGGVLVYVASVWRRMHRDDA